MCSESSSAYISMICNASSCVRSGVSYRDTVTSFPSNENDTSAGSSIVYDFSIWLVRSSGMVDSDSFLTSGLPTDRYSSGAPDLTVDLSKKEIILNNIFTAFFPTLHPSIPFNPTFSFSFPLNQNYFSFFRLYPRSTAYLPSLTTWPNWTPCPYSCGPGTCTFPNNTFRIVPK